MQYDKWWKEQTLKGDPRFRPYLVSEAFSAGWEAARAAGAMEINAWADGYQELAEREAAWQAEREATVKLLDAMETCHICKGALILEDGPIHCEDCSSDCEEHDEPECESVYSLHGKVRRLLRSGPQPIPEVIESLESTYWTKKHSPICPWWRNGPCDCGLAAQPIPEVKK